MRRKYKGILGCVILCLLITVVCLGGCSRKESPVEDFVYEMVNGEVVITGYTGTELEIYIPSKINDRPVTQIGERAFEGYDMTLIDIPDSVKMIGEYAFNKCKCLHTVRLPKEVDSIESFAFQDCVSLSEVELPKGLKKIGYWSFSGCYQLSRVELPDSLEKLGYRSFWNTALTELSIPFNTIIEDVPAEPHVELIVQNGSAALFWLQEHPNKDVNYSVAH